jgi:hypothetical protein
MNRRDAKTQGTDATNQPQGRRGAGNERTKNEPQGRQDAGGDRDERDESTAGMQGRMVSRRYHSARPVFLRLNFRT